MNSDNSDTSNNTAITAINRTEIGFGIQIIKYYNSVKATVHNGLMDNPTNGNMRDLCIKLLADGLNADDDSVFRMFFAVGKEENLKKAIENFDITKFRRIAFFLDRTSKKTDVKNLNFIAVLIGFKSRPFSKFRTDKSEVIPMVQQNNFDVEKSEEDEKMIGESGFGTNADAEGTEDFSDEPNVDQNDIGEGSVEREIEEEKRVEEINVKTQSDSKQKKSDEEKGNIVIGKSAEIQNKPGAEKTSEVTETSKPRDIVTNATNPPKKWRNAIAAAILIAASSAFYFTTIAHKAKECMQWRNYQYELVNCNPSSDPDNLVTPFDSAQFPMKQIKVSKETVFFVKGSPIVWYSKHDNVYDFFNQPGYHPISRKPLNEISSGIATDVQEGRIVSASEK